MKVVKFLVMTGRRSRIIGAWKSRKSFRFRRSRDGEKFRVSKRIKHQSRQAGVAMVKKLTARPYRLIGLLMKFKIYRYSTNVKISCILVPFFVLLILDNFLIALIVACMDIFFCALFFTFASVDKKEAIISGQFDYGEYKRIKAKKDTIAIVASLLLMVVSIVISHFVIADRLVSWLNL